jgi:lysophospholipase L1-like esterase
MKQALVLIFFAMLLGIACKKEVATTSNTNNSGITDSSTVILPPSEPEPEPEPENIVFFGSSTISQWHIEEAFAGYPVKKAGFGGKTWSSLLQLTDTIKKLNPKQVVLYSGDNDVIARKSVGSMSLNIQKLCEKIYEENPGVVITFLYTKPSDTAFHITYSDGITTGINGIEYVNRNMQKWGEQNHPDDFNVVDSYIPFLSWQPKRLAEQYYQKDKLHLNQTYGYPVLNELLAPMLLK